MSHRIDNTFQALKKEGSTALIPFIMAYDPNREASLALLHTLAEEGANLIEVGIPFSDPMADGPVIQAAGQRALSAGATLSGVLSLVAEFRKKHPSVPVILMGYYNPIYRFGAARFCKQAAESGVDGLILVDLPPEEESELTPHLSTNGIKLVRLIAPTSLGERLETLTASASGFMYYISITGITGAATASSSELERSVARIRSHTSLPVAVGFGIKTAAQAAAAAPYADAVVVGSALVERIAAAGNAEAACESARRFVRELRDGVAMRKQAS